MINKGVGAREMCDKINVTDGMEGGGRASWAYTGL